LFEDSSVSNKRSPLSAIRLIRGSVLAKFVALYQYLKGIRVPKNSKDDGHHESDYRKEGVRQNGAAIVC